ncbi:PTS transporter subunit EIIC [Suicoccus acidiformans]|uniref:PTS transporter subunit EIIC n=1 Tax=Suicoccus acidiformans TaxID=2036206 RepID=UPI001F090A21|nr:PTS transporter subunit EIIC [Suicoccus acidiformans]
MENNYRQTAAEIVEALGGKDNIRTATHCATRLRLVLNNEKAIDTNHLEAIDLVKGHFNNAGQFQIILGTGVVNGVYNEFKDITGIEEANKDDVKKAAEDNLNPVQKIVKNLADVFVPILPALVASGLMMGLNNVLTAEGLFVAGQSVIDLYPQIADLANMLNLFSNAAFTFLPILIGYSSANIFGATPVLGAVIGAIMVHPELLNGYGYGEAVATDSVPYWNILELSVAKVGYQGTVLPVIGSTYILSLIEKNLRKVVPNILDIIVTPLVSVLVTAFLTFTVIGPLLRTVGDWMTNVVLWLFNDLGAIGGAIYGVIYPILVITGMHHSLAATEIQILANIETLGGSPTFAVVSVSNVCQGAAALAMFFLMKHDEKVRSIAPASGLSALLGITEPALFGINLRYR